MTSIIVVVAILLGGLVLWLLMQNREFEVQRSKVIKAPLKSVFEAVVDFRASSLWSPFYKYDHTIKSKFSNNTREVGAWQSWQGKYIGTGKMTIESITPDKAIYMSLHFVKPMRVKHQVVYGFRAVNPNETEITWTLTGKLPFFLPFMVKKMDGMIGPDFELGLDYLAMQVDPSFPKYNITYPKAASIRPEQNRFLFMNYQGSGASMGQVIREHCAKICDYAMKEKLDFQGAATVRYNTFDPATLETNCDVGVFVKKVPQTALPAEIRLGKIAAGKFSKVIYKGPYENLPRAWNAAFSHAMMLFPKRVQTGGALETYLNSPESTKPEDLLTEICIPLKN